MKKKLRLMKRAMKINCDANPGWKPQTVGMFSIPRSISLYFKGI